MNESKAGEAKKEETVTTKYTRENPFRASNGCDYYRNAEGVVMVVATPDFASGDTRCRQEFEAAEKAAGVLTLEERIDALADKQGWCDEYDQIMWDEFGKKPRKGRKVIKPEITVESLRALAKAKGQLAAFDAEFNPKPEVKIPVVGQWITATYADNHTDTFEVTLNATQNTSSSWKATWLRKNPRDSSTWDFIYTSEGRSAGSDKTREVVSWVPATKPWAVGDLVPANTIVGRQWIGSLLNDSLNVLGLGSSNSSGYDRKIIAFVED